MQADFPTIFKENLGLQLEATYRKNVDKVSTELKRRLDYLKEVEDTKQVSRRDFEGMFCFLNLKKFYIK